MDDLGVDIFVFWCYGDLEDDLYEGPREVVDKDDLAERRLKKRLQMSFSSA